MNNNLSKNEIVNTAMEYINEIILSLNENSLDRMRLSSKSRLAVINKIDALSSLDKDEFKKAVEQIFREELMNELNKNAASFNDVTLR